MSLPFYFDVHVHGAVTTQLIERGIDVLTAQADGHPETADPVLLDRATALGRPLVTFDDDFLREASARQQAGADFAGVIFERFLDVNIGQLVTDLHMFAETMSFDELRNKVLYLPL